MNFEFKTRNDLNEFIYEMCSMLPSEPEMVIIDDEVFDRLELSGLSYPGCTSVRLVKRSEFRAESRYRERIKELEKQVEELKELNEAVRQNY